MQTENFQLDPACQPNTWLLWIGPGQYGSVALDSSTGRVKQIEYRDFDPYAVDVFVRHAAELFTDRSAIHSIRVCFRLNEWCWTPTAFTTEKDAVQKWITPFWPDRVGHRWVADQAGPADATAWVFTPDHIRDQLHHLCTAVEYRHAAGFMTTRQPSDSAVLEIIKMSDLCWFTLSTSANFRYGQPHLVESEADLIYTLAGLTRRFNLNWNDLDVYLSGQWPLDSSWISSLQDRTPRIHWRNTPWSSLNTELPAHWFTPLYDLFECA
jgi:hypothetical protein